MLMSGHMLLAHCMDYRALGAAARRSKMDSSSELVALDSCERLALC